MTITEVRPTSPPSEEPEPLPKIAVTRAMQLGVLAGGLVVGIGGSLVLSGSVKPALVLVVGFLAYLAMIYALTARLEDRREATDKLMTGIVTGAFVLVLIPLVSLIWTVADRGSARFDTTFFTETMRGVVGEGGGGKHAIIGTLIVTAIASAFAIPIGLMVAVYLVEYGKGRLARWVTTMVDVMTGVPSIVAGLFAFALFVLLTDNQGYRSGLGGGVALAVLMTPVVVRTSEEMLRLVPTDLREASYALGVPKWRTIVKVVIPTAIAGILTGVTLAIARVIGETAPLLIVAGLAQDTNTNPFSGRMTTLPVMAYSGYQNPGFPPEPGYERAWTAALVLVMIVVVLFLLARLLAKVLQPKGLR